MSKLHVTYEDCAEYNGFVTCCKQDVYQEVKYCPYCGSPIDEIVEAPVIETVKDPVMEWTLYRYTSGEWVPIQRFSLRRHALIHLRSEGPKMDLHIPKQFAQFCYGGCVLGRSEYKNHYYRRKAREHRISL